MDQKYTPQHYRGHFSLLMLERVTLIESLVKNEADLQKTAKALNTQYETLQKKCWKHDLEEHRRAIKGKSSNKEVIFQVEVIRQNQGQKIGKKRPESAEKSVN